MRVLKIIGLVLGGLIALFLIVAAILPSTYRVERTAEIKMPVEVISPLVVNLPNWPQWDPFTEQEPTAKSTFTGESGTVGSKWAWDGDIIGTGSMTIAEITTKGMRSRVEFTAPQPMVSWDNWEFTATAKGTRVKWWSEGELDYPIGRIFGLFIEGMLGPTFEKGLLNLKRISEQQTLN